MSNLLGYIQDIKNCRRQARLTSDPAVKAQWLRIAQAWMVLAEADRSNEAAAATDTNYEISLVEKDGHSVAASAVVKSANDDEIVGKAKQLIDGKTVEVHDGERLVASFPPSQ